MLNGQVTPFLVAINCFKSQLYLALLNACEMVLEGSNGISLARGMVGEHNDVYSHAIDDALSELMPDIFACVESSGGLESLKWYVPQLSPQEEESES